MTATIPETALDVEVLLHDRLNIDLEKYMEFKENDNELIIKLTRYVDKEVFGKVLGLVREWGGKYDGDNRQWTIPKPLEQKEDEKAKVSNEKLQQLGFKRASKELTKPYEGMRERIETKLQDPPKSNSPFDIVPIDALVESPFQFRSTYDEKKIEELKESVKQVGVLQPLVVRENSVGGLEIVAGHRRFKASQKADLKEIPVIKRKLSDEDATFIQLMENIQREDASDYDTGTSLCRLNRKGWSQEQLGKKLGISQQQISNYIAHYRFCEATFTTAVVNVNLNKIKERQTRGLRELNQNDDIVKILKEINPCRIDSEVIKQIWTRLHIPTGEFAVAIETFLRDHDYMPSLLRYEKRGPFGDARFPGTIPGFLLVQLIRQFKPSTVFDPMDGGKTTRDVCQAMEISYVGNDLLDEDGYDLVTVALERLPKSDLTFFHPPYWDLIKYSSDNRDLSNSPTWEAFCNKLHVCVEKLLQRTKRLAILIGDVIKDGRFLTPLIPILQYNSRLERILIREYETVTGIHGFYDAIHKGKIPQRHDYLILLKGELPND